jgi:hypothetical protein
MAGPAHGIGGCIHRCFVAGGGPVQNTLQAYRRHSTLLFAEFLAGRPLTLAQEVDLQAYFAARHAHDQSHDGQPALDSVQALLPLGAA